jgi:hypothetical protein
VLPALPEFCYNSFAFRTIPHLAMSTEHRVRAAQLESGFKLATGGQHKVILQGKVALRLEIEDAFFNTDSAVFLPDVPAEGGDGGDPEEKEFSNDDFWKLVRNSHKHFTETLFEEPFDPDGSGGGGAGVAERESALHVIIAPLRFLEQNPDFRLLIAGHTDTSGGKAHNEKLSDARSRSVLALLEGDRDAFVQACQDFNADEDDPVILEFASREFGFPCEPASPERASPEEVEAFQKAYNEKFEKNISVDGVVGKQTRGAYFDLYEDTMQRGVGGESALADLRGKLQFVDDDVKFLACGEDFPIENPEADGFKSQRNRRVELLFFEESEAPEIADGKAGEKIYKEKVYDIKMLDRDEIEGGFSGPVSEGGSKEQEETKLVDAEAPPPGVGEPEEELVTEMDRKERSGEEDPLGFVEPFDETHPEVAHQAFDSGKDVPEGSTALSE